MTDLQKIKKELQSLANPKQAELLQRYFKTAKGQYGEGDVFLGLKMGEQRQIAKKYWKNASMKNIQDLLNNKIHEYRMIALLILIQKYFKSSVDDKKDIFYFYLNNAKKVNNWDLVDLSAPNIVGDFLLNNYDKKRLIYDLAQSNNLWEKRIAVISTFAFIRQGKFEDALAISGILLGDHHDLIHKAVGWALREIGKKDVKILEDFLKKNYRDIPRTTLRYAIEKFPEEKRKKFLGGGI